MCETCEKNVLGPQFNLLFLVFYRFTTLHFSVYHYQVFIILSGHGLCRNLGSLSQGSSSHQLNYVCWSSIHWPRLQPQLILLVFKLYFNSTFNKYPTLTPPKSCKEFQMADRWVMLQGTKSLCCAHKCDSLLFLLPPLRFLIYICTACNSHQCILKGIIESIEPLIST